MPYGKEHERTEAQPSANPTRPGTWGMVSCLASCLALLGCEEAKSTRSDAGEQSAEDASTPPPPPPPGDAGAPSCGEAPVSAASFSRKALLESVAACATHQLCEFSGAAGNLRIHTEAYTNAPSEEALEAAREAFRTTMERWSTVELFQFGPIATKAQDMYQGQGIRSLIYAWPSTSRCRVEEQIATEAYADGGFDKVLITGRGLYAVEYGLFFEGTETECLSSSPTGQAWPTLSAEELSARKARYTLAVADDVWTRAYNLHRRFSPEGENFSQTLAEATDYPSEQEALNVVAWSLIYIEKEVKDWKLGIPAGYTTMAPVSGPETPFALVAIENLRANLRGFRALFQGCGADGEGLGFDDWLTSAGHGELASDIISAWEGAQTAADAFPPLHQASVEEVHALYAQVKVLTDLLKNELFGAGSPINLKLPASVEGDTD